MAMQEELIPVEIVGLSTSPRSGGAFVLMLGEISGTRKLPVVVGENEATAIAVGVEKKTPPRPMSHDLLCNLMRHVGAEVSDILIDGLADGTFFAKIRFFLNGEHLALDSRPSDAVAIAVRLDVDILVSESILEEAGIPLGEGESAAPVEPAVPVSPVEQLEAKLARAIEEEDYEEAARVRDALAKLRE